MQREYLRLALCALLIGAASASQLDAQSPVAWTNAKHNNSWETARNWNTGQIPDTGSDVQIGILAQCNLASFQAVNSLSLSNNVGHLNLVTGGDLSVSKDLFIGANCSITGMGRILMSPSNALFANNGLIEANVNGATLFVQLYGFGGGASNGMFRAANGGLLRLAVAAGSLDFGGATISASGFGSIGLLDNNGGNGVWKNTALRTDTGGIIKIQLVTLADGTNFGNTEMADNGMLYIGGSGFTNNGVLTLNNFSTVRFVGVGNAPVDPEVLFVLRGAGTFNFDNGLLSIGDVIFSDSQGNTVIRRAVVINGNGHTLRGGWEGTSIQAASRFINNGTIAPGGVTAAGTLNVGVPYNEDNFLLGFPSELSFTIAGRNAGTDYGVLQRRDFGAQTLNGRLTVKLASGFVPNSSDVFTVITTQASIQGAFLNVRSGGRMNTTDGSGSFQVDYSNQSSVMLSNFGAPLLPAHVANISSRAQVNTDDQVAIAGFIIGGTQAKRVAIRGIGPSLQAFGLQNTLPDPVLELHDNSSVLATNDNWRDTQESEIQASGYAPANDFESVIIASLPPGAYTAILSGANHTTGIGLIEVYDLDPQANSILKNVSTRAFVGNDDQALIGGIITQPLEGNSKRILLRAIGPSLAPFGLQGLLLDPALDLHNADGAIIASNDNWRDSQEFDITSTGLQPADGREAAIAITLAPGNYTGVVRAANGQTGVALVEVYDLQ